MDLDLHPTGGTYLVLVTSLIGVHQKSRFVEYEA